METFHVPQQLIIRAVICWFVTCGQLVEVVGDMRV